jgi:acyl-CoA synthetase (AMP-forming)/AMP-acid ligase II
MIHTSTANPIPIRLDARPESLTGQLAALAKARPDQVAVVLVDHEHEQEIPYGEIYRRAREYAGLLRGAGLQPGDRVALILQHGEAVIHGFWGAMLLGAIPSIFSFLSDKLDPERYFESVRALVDHAGVRAVITISDLEDELRRRLTGLDVAIINAEHLAARSAEDNLPADHSRAGEETAFLQHSSGSTGLQKGVMLSHRAVINQLASYSAAIDLRPDDVIVSWLPLYHDMGLIAGFILPLMQGIRLVLMSPFQWVRDPKMLIHAIHRHRGTLCWLPNFAYNFLATRVRDADLAGIDLSSWRAVINCSEPVHAESHAAFLSKYAPYGLRESALAVCYAMAESTFAVIQTEIGTPPRLDGVDRRALMEDRRAEPAKGDQPSLTFVSNGRPIANCAVQVVDEARSPLPDRRIGEIAVRSDSMMTGYYRRPEASAEVMADGWYFTGDMGYLADGELYITGRKKDLIIVGGRNIYPQDIELLLNDLPGLHPGRSAVFGVFNGKLGTEDIAIVAELAAAAPDDAEAKAAISREIRARVTQSLDVAARYVHLVDAKWLIKTSSGKIARGANREKFLREVLNEAGSARDDLHVGKP